MKVITNRDGRHEAHPAGRTAPGSLCGMMGAVAVSVMGASFALACGAFAADAEKSAAVHRAAVTAPDIAGRWSGSHYGFGDVRARCGDGPCTLTIDITPCGAGWCGVLVTGNGACGKSAMKVEAADGKETFLHFNGRLALEPKAADYSVQATLWKKEATGERHLDFIGDTGTELMFMRRSFPFQAHLARTGEAVCTGDKATS